MSSANYIPRSGVGGSVFVQGHTLAVDHWDAQLKNNIIDAPSFVTAPWMTRAGGLKQAQINISGTYNDLFNPFLNSIKLGTQVGVILGINTTTSATYICWVADVPVVDDVDGLCTYSMTLLSEYEFEDFSGTNA